jgi:transcription initiation factor TFIIE subunit alpha
VEEEDTDNFDDIDAEVPKVSVNGRYVPLHEITEDDQRQMTTEEYQVCQYLYLHTLIFATKY